MDQTFMIQVSLVVSLVQYSEKHNYHICSQWWAALPKNKAALPLALLAQIYSGAAAAALHFHFKRRLRCRFLRKKRRFFKRFSILSTELYVTERSKLNVIS